MALSIGATALVVACGSRPSPADRESPTQTIEAALATHTDALLAIPGVVGVGIGRCDGHPCIVVMVAERTPEVSQRVPATLAGYPVDVRVTGSIEARAPQEVEVSFTLTSSAFVAGGSIPVEHTCDGADVAPPLAWSGTPAGVKTFALIVDDPDAPAGTWVHWVLFNLPGAATALPQGIAAVQGRNDFRKTGYGGPCPPPGKAHRYCFTLYGLDGPLALRAGATKADVERAMQGHILATAQLIGTYSRQR